jgi:hypothetical protein
MLRRCWRARSRRLRLAAWLAVLTAAPTVAVGTASAAQADAVRAQELWVLNAIDAPAAWQTTMGHGVTVALIDSGVNRHVSDLAGSVIEGANFTGVNTPPSDPHWGVHGTWMASLIAGHGHPAGGPNGIMGVAPQAHILSIRAVTDQGDPADKHYEHESEGHVQGELANAIDYAVSRHVQVISMSLGYQGASLPVRVAIERAVAKGIVVIASSGNSGGARSARGGHAPYSFPADYPGVLGVGAIGRSGAPASFSSNNLSVEVAAPGVKVPAQGRDGQYWLVSGTSPACALTAGVAALIKSRYPGLPPALVEQAITASTRNRPHGGYNEEVGFGTVDAAAALTAAGRLAHGGDAGAGHGLAAAARFGGGPAAIGPVPVAPRGREALIIGTLLALLCLALLAACAFWLIITRGGSAAPAWPGATQPATGPSPGYGPPTGPSAGPGAPRGPSAGYGPPPGPSAGSGTAPGPVVGYGPPPGLPAGYRPVPGPPAEFGRPGDGVPGDWRTADYAPSGDYGPQADSGPWDGHGSPDRLGPPDGLDPREGPLGADDTRPSPDPW